MARLVQEIERQRSPYLISGDSRNSMCIELGENVSVSVTSLESLNKVKKLAEGMAKNMKPNDSLADSQRAYYKHGIQ